MLSLRPIRNRQARDWIGFLIIYVLGLDREDKVPIANGKEMFRRWRKPHV
jgi:hypothetical protein